MSLSEVQKKENKKKLKKKRADEEFNIRYHDVNPQWNYTISPRVKKNDEK